MTSITYRKTALAGAALCLLAVAIGAFGAHALKDLLLANQREGVFELANRYQFYHGLALILTAALFQRAHSAQHIALVAILMTVGSLIFSGSLYLLAITQVTWLGAITPIGGILLIAAWALLAWQIKTA